MLKLLQLPIGQFLVSDIGPDHFLVPANGRYKVSASPEFMAQKIPHLAFDILRDPYRTLPFHVAVAESSRVNAGGLIDTIDGSPVVGSVETETINPPD